MWQCFEGLSGEKSRGGRHIRDEGKKGRKMKEAERGGWSNGKEWEKWAEIMDGGYYIGG